MYKTARSRWIQQLLNNPKLRDIYYKKLPTKAAILAQPAYKYQAFEKFIRSKAAADKLYPFDLHRMLTPIKRMSSAEPSNIFYGKLYRFLGRKLGTDHPLVKRLALNALKKVKKLRSKYLKVIKRYGEELLQPKFKDISDTDIDDLYRKWSAYDNMVNRTNGTLSIIKPDMSAKLEKPTGIDPQNTIWSKKKLQTLREHYSDFLFGSPHFQVASGYHPGNSNNVGTALLLKLDPKQIAFQRLGTQVFTTPHLGVADKYRRLSELHKFNQTHKPNFGHRPQFDSLPTYQAVFTLPKNPLFQDIPGVDPYVAVGNDYYKAMIKRLKEDKKSKLWRNIQ